MAEVFTFPTVIEGTAAEKLPPNPDLIEMIEKVLAGVKEGNIRAVALVAVHELDGEPFNCYWDDDAVLYHELSSGLDLLKARMVEEFATDFSTFDVD